MHVLFAVLLLGFQVGGDASSALSRMWEEWKSEHSKSYDNQVGRVVFWSLMEGGDPLFGWLCWFQTQMAVRRAAWERNARLVARHNLEASAGKHSFTLELNHLADLVRRVLLLQPSLASERVRLVTSPQHTVETGSSSPSSCAHTLRQRKSFI